MPYQALMNAFWSSAGVGNRGGYGDDAECSLWRGQFIEEFASAEAAVSEALAFLSEIASSGAASLLPHLVGKRFEALRSVVDAKGPLAALGPRVAAALDEFKDLHRYRTYLCHGTSTVIPDPSGKWCLIIRLTSFRAATVERSTLEIPEDEAKRILVLLRRARVRLEGQLRGMLASFPR